MYPIFIAHGPAFKKNYECPPFNNVDIYPLMCYILKVIPAINNGSLANVKQMIAEVDYYEYVTSKIFIFFFLEFYSNQFIIYNIEICLE